MIDVHSKEKTIHADPVKELIIGGQFNAETLRFIFKDDLNGVNLANPNYTWYIEYKNRHGDGEAVKLHPEIADGFVKLPWTPGLGATSVPGRLTFQIYAIEAKGAEITKRWISQAASIIVQESVEATPLGPLEASAFPYYLTIFENLKEAAQESEEAAASSALAASGSASAANNSKEAAAGSALAASGSASAAHDSKEAAASSALAASGSASAANNSKEAAAGSALAASGSASAAHDSKEAAASSALAASGSASAANNSKEAAAGSALAASGSASSAHDSKEAAAGSALAASGSASAAALSEENAESFAASALASKETVEVLAGSMLDKVFYGLRRRADGREFRTGAAARMSAARSNGVFNPTVSDFRKVKPWADIRLCLFDILGQIISTQGDEDFTAKAAELTEGGLDCKYNFGAMFFPFYYRIWEGTDEQGISFIEWDISQFKTPGFEIHPTFLRPDGSIRPYVVIASYATGVDSNWEPCSKPNVTPSTSRSLLAFDALYKLEPNSKWIGSHFTTNDLWTILAIIEFGSLDLQSVVGQGMSSTPYANENQKCTVAQSDASSIIISNAGATDFREGMTVQIGSAYSNSTIKQNAQITAIDTYNASNKRITVNGAAFNTVAGSSWISCWMQPDSLSNLLLMGTSCGWLNLFGAEHRSHVYLYGLVSPYANVNEWSRGKMRKGGNLWLNFNQEESITISDPEDGGFTNVGTYTFGSASYGWISKLKCVEIDGKKTQIVSEIGGNSIGDVIYYADTSRMGIYSCAFGGNWSDGALYGPFCERWDFSPSDSSINRGDRVIILEPEAP